MMKAPHVCIISCQHVPDDVRVTHKEGLSMREAGFRVTWVGPKRPRTGKDHGIDFRYYKLGEGRIGRLLHVRRAHKLAMQVDNVDVYFGVEPDSAAVAAKLARRNGAKAVFDVHETYHDDMLVRFAGRLGQKLLGGWVRRSLLRTMNKCDLVISVSETVQKPYSDSRSPKMIVHNYAPAAFAADGPADIFASEQDPIVIMHGKFTPNRGTECTLEAAALVREQLGRPVRVVGFTAATSDEDRSAVATREVARRFQVEDCLDLKKAVPFMEMPNILRQCDVGLVTYDRSFGIRGLSNRLFEYMAIGLPIVGSDYSIETRRFVEASDCGLLVDSENPQEIADAIIGLAKDPQRAKEMGRKGREVFLSKYSWQCEVEPLLEQIRQWSGC